MDETAYIQERLDDQINWYSQKSKTSQNWFKTLRVIEIIAAATIPFVAGFISLSKFQELWIEYRTTSETLKHHKYLFLTKSSPYDSEDAFQALVQTVEALISKENSNWNNYIKQTEKEKNDG